MRGRNVHCGPGHRPVAFGGSSATPRTPVPIRPNPSAQTIPGLADDLIYRGRRYRHCPQGESDVDSWPTAALGANVRTKPKWLSKDAGLMAPSSTTHRRAAALVNIPVKNHDFAETVGLWAWRAAVY